MKKNVKRIVMLALAATMVIGGSATVLAAQWHQDSNGSWYQEDDGSYPVNVWKWIDGDNDGMEECYYFDENGYSLKDSTTPDGYTVDQNGAWVVNGLVQTRTLTPGIAQSYTCTIWLMGAGDRWDPELTDYYAAQLFNNDIFYEFYDPTGTVRYTRENKPEWVIYEEDFTECVVTGEVFTAADGFSAIKVTSVVPK